jgi:hypothetical protein
MSLHLISPWFFISSPNFCSNLLLLHIFPIFFLKSFLVSLFMKILLPPAPVHQPDQVFGTKRNTIHINFEPGRMPPLPVLFRRRPDWLIFSLIKLGTVPIRYGTWLYTFICGRVGGRREIISFRTCRFLAQKIYVNNCTYVWPRKIRAVVFDFQAV